LLRCQAMALGGIFAKVKKLAEFVAKGGQGFVVCFFHRVVEHFNESPALLETPISLKNRTVFISVYRKTIFIA